MPNRFASYRPDQSDSALHADAARSAALMPAEPCAAPCVACTADAAGYAVTIDADTGWQDCWSGQTTESLCATIRLYDRIGFPAAIYSARIAPASALQDLAYRERMARGVRIDDLAADDYTAILADVAYSVEASR